MLCRLHTLSTPLLFLLSVIPCALAQSDSHRSPPSSFSVTAIGDVKDHSIVAIERALGHHVPRILAELEIAEMPRFSVKVWSDPDEFRSVFVSGGGQGGVTRGYVNSEIMEVRLLDGEAVDEIAVHEFAHLASLVVNPKIAANPFWLWESVALYLDASGPPDTTELTCITENRKPTLDELSTPPGMAKVYRMGYLIVDHVVETWGRGALMTLIKTNGDIETSLGISREEFEQNLHAFLLENYEFAEELVAMSRDQLLERFSGNTLTNTEFGQSTFLAADGRLYFGSHGTTRAEGRWSVSDSDRVCIEVGDAGVRCSTWYQEDASTFLLDSDSDCVLQTWDLAVGDAQGFTEDVAVDSR